MKEVIGILSILLFFVNEFDSCAIDLVNLFGGVKKVDGTAGMVLGLFMLAAGVISLCSKVYRLRIIASIVFYCIAVTIGYYNIESCNEIKIWLLINLGFAAMLSINLILKWDKYKYYTVELPKDINKDANNKS